MVKEVENINTYNYDINQANHLSIVIIPITCAQLYRGRPVDNINNDINNNSNNFYGHISMTYSKVNG